MGFYFPYPGDVSQPHNHLSQQQPPPKGPDPRQIKDNEFYDHTHSAINWKMLRPQLKTSTEKHFNNPISTSNLALTSPDLPPPRVREAEHGAWRGQMLELRYGGRVSWCAWAGCRSWDRAGQQEVVLQEVDRWVWAGKQVSSFLPSRGGGVWLDAPAAWLWDAPAAQPWDAPAAWPWDAPVGPWGC